MRRRWVMLAPLALGVVVVSAVRARQAERDHFPHATHARFFPSCTGCHAGAAAADTTAALFPSAEACAACHDGKEVRKVNWSPPQASATNLRFSHARHAAGLAESGMDSVPCARCHTAAGGTSAAPTTVAATMRRVKGPQPQACLACHRAPSHLAKSARCRTCHVPLTRAQGLDAARIAALPKPPDHEAKDFVLAHGQGLRAATAQARCSICHARESCQRCHRNAESVPAIAALQPDARVAQLVAGRAAVYPKPANHNSGWSVKHAKAARANPESCSNCHVQSGCQTCHIGRGAEKQIAQLPNARPGQPQGAIAPAAATPSVAVKSAPGANGGGGKVLAFLPPRRIRAHPAGWVDSHGPAAASGSDQCSSCHEKTFCSSCHEGSSKPVFHPADYVSRHGTDAYSGARDCNSCHNTETFCKSCHQGLGVASRRGSTDLGFHTGQPMWLLQHGEAARKGLEGCVSCHRQEDCARCHSATGGWGVNPHGSNFNAGGSGNQLMCARCHVGTPGQSQ